MTERDTLDTVLRLEQRFIDEMVAHARAEEPNEACGLIAGVGGKAVKLFRGTNVHENRTVRYSLDPRELLNALREVDDNGWELLAIYHSHPKSPAFPSATDLELAFYPDSFYIIVSLMDESPVARAFRIVDGKIHEGEIIVE